MPSRGFIQIHFIPNRNEKHCEHGCPFCLSFIERISRLAHAKLNRMLSFCFVLLFVLVGFIPMTAAGDNAPEKENALITPMMFSEAKLPRDYPAPGPVNEVIVKTYPTHRLARVTGEVGDNSMFMRLFRHIERNDIAMTAPVEMNWSKEPAPDKAGGAESMAFLYRSTEIGSVGVDEKDNRIVVTDTVEMSVVSIGVRGSYDQKTFMRSLHALEAWLEVHPEWTRSGSPRMLAYNSPFVPWFLKYSEVQIPVSSAGKQKP